jgi:hypothetical protein
VQNGDCHALFFGDKEMLLAARRIFVSYLQHLSLPPLLLPCPHRRRTGVEAVVGEGKASSWTAICAVGCGGDHRISWEGVVLAMVVFSCLRILAQEKGKSRNISCSIPREVGGLSLPSIRY